jgi:hypothetical protein
VFNIKQVLFCLLHISFWHVSLLGILSVISFLYHKLRIFIIALTVRYIVCRWSNSSLRFDTSPYHFRDQGISSVNGEHGPSILSVVQCYWI